MNPQSPRIPTNYNSFHQKTTKNPDLSVLKPLLTMGTIQQYPKLSLMIYEALKPNVQIFDNEYMSFVDICTKNKLIDFNVLQIR